MAVQARFFIQTITRVANNPNQVNVTMTPVTRGEENKEWSEYTPSGKIELTITKGGATTWFADRLGKELAITFEDRPEDETSG